MKMTRRKNYSNENQFLRSLDGLAYGLFCSQVIGYTLNWIGTLLRQGQLSSWGNMITNLTGCAVGIGIAYATGARGIVLISSALAGAICQGGGTSWMICAYIAIMFSVYVGEFLRNKTPIDIFLTPMITVASACVMVSFVAPYINIGVNWLMGQISIATTFSPVIMGMLVAIMMAILCVTPLNMLSVISVIGLGSIGCGAALAGICGTMLGLAIMSVDDNDLGDVIAIGIGTPILQFKNILKNPLILIPPILSALITGALSTSLFKLECTSYGASVGCLFFEGPLAVINIMGNQAWLGLLITDIILPILICFSVYRSLKKLGWIKAGDLKIYHL